MEQALTLNERETNSINLAVTIELVKMFIKTILKAGLIGIVAYNIFLANTQLNSTRIIPMKIESTETKDLKRTKEALAILKLSNDKIPKYAESSIMAAKVAGVDPVLIVALMWSESRFLTKAKSSMGYVGVMQTPTATGYVSSDTLHGAEKLREKLIANNGELLPALTNYKGSKYMVNGKPIKSKGLIQAQEVLTLYSKLNKQINRG